MIRWDKTLCSHGYTISLHLFTSYHFYFTKTLNVTYKSKTTIVNAKISHAEALVENACSGKMACISVSMSDNQHL